MLLSALNFIQNNNNPTSTGQSLAEYGLILTLIAMACMVSFGNIGQAVNQSLQSLVDVTASSGVVGDPPAF